MVLVRCYVKKNDLSFSYFVLRCIFVLGKSNLLDAIAFVLGIENKHIRSISLPSLIYTPYTTEEDKPTM
jgi:hypothetical protein